MHFNFHISNCVRVPVFTQFVYKRMYIVHIFCVHIVNCSIVANCIIVTKYGTSLSWAPSFIQGLLYPPPPNGDRVNCHPSPGPQLYKIVLNMFLISPRIKNNRLDKFISTSFFYNPFLCIKCKKTESDFFLLKAFF